jgi:hypothetical protein
MHQSVEQKKFVLVQQAQVQLAQQQPELAEALQVRVLQQLELQAQLVLVEVLQVRAQLQVRRYRQ